MTAKHLGILFDNGSESAAAQMACALETRGFQTHALNVERSGSDLVEALFALSPDKALLALRGDRAGAGCLQGLLELLHIPYTGSGILGSAIAFDVSKTRELLRLHGIRVPSHYVGRCLPTEGMLEQHGGFGYPVQLRRRAPGGFQIRVEQADDWQRAVVKLAALEGDELVVERCHGGDAYWVALLDGRVLGIGAEGDANGLSEVRSNGLLQVAKSAVRALCCCQGPSLVRLVVSRASNEWVTDVEVAPGLGRESRFVRIAASAGYDYATLCETVVEGARLQWVGRASSGSKPRRVSQPPMLDGVSRVA